MVSWILGPVSISDKTSYCKILWSNEAARLVVLFIASLKFNKHIGSTAAEVPVSFQSDCTILDEILAASRLCKILQ